MGRNAVFRLVGIGAILAFLAPSLPVKLTAQNGLEPHLGPLAGVVQLGTEGSWTSTAQQGWFTLTNERAPGAIKYFWTENEALAGQSYRVSVNVFSTSDEARSHAGILFNHRGNDQYMAVTIATNGSANILIRTPSDGVRITAAENVQPRLDGTDILALEVSATEVRSTLNGETMFTIDLPGGAAPRFGILAWDVGVAAFTGLKLEKLNPAPLAPDKGGTTPPPIPSGGSTPPPIPAGGGTPPPIPASGGTPPPVPGVSARLSLKETQIRLGTTLGIFMHELAHAVIGETNLPATGPEEDVADNFAAYVMASAAAESPLQSHDFVKGVTEASILLWYYFAQFKEQQQIEHDWQDEHAPDATRFRHQICIVYASNPHDFEELATMVGLEQQTKQRCLREYQTKFDAWEELLALRARNLGPDLPGAFPADEPGGKLTAVFQPPTTQFGRETEAMLKQSGLILPIVQYFEAYFVWPRDMNIHFRDCEVINAWYDPTEPSVTMCYSAIELFSALVRDGRSI